MIINKKNILKALLALGLCMGIYSGQAFAEEEVQVLVIDNGSPVQVSEPSTFGLILAGAIGLGLVAYRNRKNK
ncbi:MAG: PEP-CTERM sorting domain-containing protein [Gammaproteobacteria bacterium]